MFLTRNIHFYLQTSKQTKNVSLRLLRLRLGLDIGVDIALITVAVCMRAHTYVCVLQAEFALCMQITIFTEIVIICMILTLSLIVTLNKIKASSLKG